MKATISLLAVQIVAVTVLTGCGKNNPGDAVAAPETNSSPANAHDSMGGSTHFQITNSMPDPKTNRPNGSNISGAF